MAHLTWRSSLPVPALQRAVMPLAIPKALVDPPGPGRVGTVFNTSDFEVQQASKGGEIGCHCSWWVGRNLVFGVCEHKTQHPRQPLQFHILYQGVQERLARLFRILYCGFGAGIFQHVVHTEAGSGPSMKVTAVEPLELLLTVGVFSLSEAGYHSLSLDGSLQIRMLSGRGTKMPRLEHQGSSSPHGAWPTPSPRNRTDWSNAELWFS